MKASRLLREGAPTMISVTAADAVQARPGEEGSGRTRALLPLAYMSYLPAHADYPAFRALGYDLVSVCAYLSDRPINEYTDMHPLDRGLWIGPDTYDFSPLDAALRTAAGTPGAPDAASVLLRVNLNTPSWWRDAHPDQLIRLSGGRVCMQSPASPVWREDAGRALDALCAWLSASGWDRSVIALQLGAMNTEEWLAISGPEGLGDVSAPALDWYRSCMEQKYGSIAALNAAYGSEDDPCASFDGSEPPSPDMIGAVMSRDFMDVPGPDGAPDPNCLRVTDWLRAFNESVADAVTSLCTRARAASGGRMLIGCFYGYIGQLNAALGHAAVRRVLDCPDIDFLASPFTYVDARHSARDWYFHGVTDSFRRRGRLWFMEADVRTHLSSFLKDNRPWLLEGSETKNYEHPVWLGPDTEARSISDLTRAFAKILTARHAMWWFDMWGGWYRSGAYTAFMARAREVYARHYPVPPRETPRAVVLLDPDAAYAAGTRFWALVNDQMIALGHMGCPYAILSLDDLPSVDPDDYDLYVLPAPSLNAPAVGDGPCAGRDPAPVIAAVHRLTGRGKTVMITGSQTAFVDDPARRLHVRRGEAFPWPELASAADRAGIHRYTTDGSLVFTDGTLLCVTAQTGGGHLIRLPRPARLTDVFRGGVLRAEDGCVTVEMEEGESRLWEIENL